MTDDPRDAADGLRSFMPELSIEDILAAPYLWIGTVESICADIVAARERWDFSYFTVFQDALDATAAIVARLANT